MANLTITVPDDVLRRARERAAREGTSVNSVLRAELASYVDDEAEVAQALDEFLRLASKSSGRSSGKRWSREEIQRPVRTRR